MKRAMAFVLAWSCAVALAGCACNCPCVQAANQAQREEEAILAKFPPPEWGAAKIESLNRRSVLEGVFPSLEEQEFIDRYDEWKAALQRRESGRDR